MVKEITLRDIEHSAWIHCSAPCLKVKALTVND